MIYSESDPIKIPWRTSGGWFGFKSSQPALDSSRWALSVWGLNTIMRGLTRHQPDKGLVEAGPAASWCSLSGPEHVALKWLTRSMKRYFSFLFSRQTSVLNARKLQSSISAQSCIFLPNNQSPSKNPGLELGGIS